MSEIIECKVIDNFLDEEYFSQIEEAIINPEYFPWYYTPKVNWNDDGNNFHCYFEHLIFEDRLGGVTGLHYNLFEPFRELLNIFVLKRIKANLYPHNSELFHHADHIDFAIPNQGAIFSLNTCDGGTVLEDGTIIKSVKNRLLLFNAGKMHHSTNCTDAKARININFNYISY